MRFNASHPRTKRRRVCAGINHEGREDREDREEFWGWKTFARFASFAHFAVWLGVDR